MRELIEDALLVLVIALVIGVLTALTLYLGG